MSRDPQQPEDTDDDVQSDPALDDEESSDWSAEGGATPTGPATDPDDGTP